MAKPSDWAGKVFSLVLARNTRAAIEQIKVAPTVRDLQALQAVIKAAKMAGKHRDLDSAIDNSLILLAAPRLHRSP